MVRNFVYQHLLKRKDHIVRRWACWSSLLLIPLLVTTTYQPFARGYSDQVYQVQSKLAELGYDVGALDGLWGKRTRQALMDYQQQQGLRVTGEMDRATLVRLGLVEEDFDKPAVFVQLGHSGAVSSVAVSPDDRYALSASGDATLKLWELASGKEIRTFKGHKGDVEAVAFLPDGRRVLSGSKDMTLKLWDVTTGKTLKTFTGHTRRVTAIAISPKGRYALSAGLDNTLRLWDLASGKEIRTFNGGAWVVAYSPDGRRAVSGSMDKTLKLWDVTTGKTLKTFTGHTRRVTAVAFAPDGRYVLSGSRDKTVKLWDTATGQTIHTLQGHSGDITAVAFAANGRRALSGSWDHTIRFWDLTTGNLLRNFIGHTWGVSSIIFTKDGYSALSGHQDGTLRLWDAASGNAIRTFKGILGQVRQVAYSPDSRYALSLDTNRSFNLWDTDAGHKLRTWKGPAGDIEAAAFTPDGRFILSVSQDIVLTLGDAITGKTVKTLRKQLQKMSPIALSADSRYAAVAINEDRTVKIYEVNSGKEARSLATNMRDIHSVALSPDGRQLLLGNDEGLLILWDLTTGRKVKTFNVKSGDPRVNWASHDPIVVVAFAPDGRHALWGNYDRLILLDLVSGKRVRSFKGRYYQSSDHYAHFTTVAFSPDGRYLAAGNRDATIELWDVSTGQEIRTLRGHTGMVLGVGFSRDSRSPLSVGLDRTLKRWDVTTGRAVETLQDVAWGYPMAFSPEGRCFLSLNFVRTLKRWDVVTGREADTVERNGATGDFLALSPDARYALGESWEGEGRMLRLWEVAGGRDVKRLKGHANREAFTCAAFSRDKRYVLAGNKDGSLDLWDLSLDKELWSRKAHNAGVISVAIAPDGRYALSGGGDNTLKLWDIEKGTQKMALKGHSGKVQAVAFAPDSRYALSGSDDATLKLWRLTDGKAVKTLRGHGGTVNSVAVSPDGRYALSGSVDGTMRLWKLDSGGEVVQMVAFDNTEWVTLTPDGYYTASANGDKFLNIRIGNTVSGIDQYRSTLYKPLIVEQALQLGDAKKATAQVLGGARPTLSDLQSIEPPFIVIKTPEEKQRLASLETSMSVYIEDRNQPIQWVKAYINGRQVTGPEGRGITVAAKDPGPPITAVGIEILEGKQTLDIKLPIVLEPGENLLEVVAFNGFSEGRKAIRVHAVETQASNREALLPNLWILAIGINHYPDKRLTDLSYAVADAHGIVEAFEQQQGKLFRQVHSLVISDKSTQAPTYENILDSMDHLSRAGHQDVVLLFVAGHGLNDNRGDFYFLPRDATFLPDGRIKRSRAIAWHVFKSTLDLPAKKIILADTCHSEGLSGKKTRAVDNDRFVKELQDANAVIFTSSRGNELSQEDPQWGHGAFTYVLLQGLSGKADLIKDGKISMKELDAYVSEHVPKLTTGAQHPITFTPDGYVNFPIALVR